MEKIKVDDEKVIKIENGYSNLINGFYYVNAVCEYVNGKLINVVGFYDDYYDEKIHFFQSKIDKDDFTNVKTDDTSFDVYGEIVYAFKLGDYTIEFKNSKDQYDYIRFYRDGELIEEKINVVKQ